MLGAFFSSILGKVSAGLLLVALAALGYFYVEHLKDARDLSDKDAKISQQNTKIDTLQGTVDQNKLQLDGMKNQGTIDDATRKDNTTGQAALVTKDTTVSQVAKRKIVAIEAKYASQPQTPQVLAAKDAEVSQTRLVALTNVFCNSSPNDPSCLSAAASAASAAASAASR